jgi:predicted RNase H-like HicB family nuclease
MALNWYWAIIERTDEGYFAHLPDLPGPTARGDTDKEALVLLAEFADDHVGDLIADGHQVPAASNEPERDPDVEECGRAIVPVEVPGTTIRVSLSIDQALLKRIDRVAERVGETRSGFIAGAALQRIRAETKSALADADIRTLRSISLAEVVQEALGSSKG